MEVCPTEFSFYGRARSSLDRAMRADCCWKSFNDRDGEFIARSNFMVEGLGNPSCRAINKHKPGERITAIQFTWRCSNKSNASQHKSHISASWKKRFIFVVFLARSRSRNWFVFAVGLLTPGTIDAKLCLSLKTFPKFSYANRAN